MRVVSVAAVAAFVAAGFSLVGVVVNVVLNARLTGRSKRQEWRRDYVLPIVTEIEGYSVAGPVMRTLQ
jgi:hypothetical protein